MSITDIFNEMDSIDINENPNGDDQVDKVDTYNANQCKCLHPFVRSFSEGMVLFREKKQCEKCAS